MSKRRSNPNRARRDVFTIANRPALLPRPLSIPRSMSDNMLSRLSEYEDRRQWHPQGRQAPARSFSKTRHRLEVPNAVRVSSRLPSAVQFKNPKGVLVCVRRSQRKEVMHAMGLSGRKGQRRPRRSEYSSIRCR